MSRSYTIQYIHIKEKKNNIGRVFRNIPNLYKVIILIAYSCFNAKSRSELKFENILV
jgi:hypothetical protein